MAVAGAMADDDLLIGDDEPDDRLATAEPNPRSILDGAARAIVAPICWLVACVR